MDKEIEAAALAGDSGSENELAKTLRALPGFVRFRYVNDLLATNQPVALRLIRRLRWERGQLRYWLLRSLDDADVSTIALWLVAIVPQLGVARSIGLLKGQVREKPEIVRAAARFMPGCLSPYIVRDYQGALRKLCFAADDYCD